MSKKIYRDLPSLADILHKHKREFWESYRINYKIICTSIPGDPIHVGHLSILRESAKLGQALVVLVNSDRFLMEKKGYVFMPLEERMEIMAGFEWVDFVVPWDEGNFVDGALSILQPDVFSKGGDRSNIKDVAVCEVNICKKLGIELILGVGGSCKVQSSSKLVDDVVNKMKGLR